MLNESPRQKYWVLDQIQFVEQAELNKLAIEELVFFKIAGVSPTILINLKLVHKTGIPQGLYDLRKLTKMINPSCCS